MITAFNRQGKEALSSPAYGDNCVCDVSDARQNLKFSSLYSGEEIIDRMGRNPNTIYCTVLSLSQLCFIFNQTSFKILLRMKFAFNPHRRFPLEKSVCKVQNNACTVRPPTVLNRRQKGPNRPGGRTGEMGNKHRAEIPLSCLYSEILEPSK